ncbi:putative DnaJ domain-containing protein [Medicago truncatula]|uniref:Putative DnaJ domain-containing protein n=1 Tax=Medicago truncatula TaxID=3880 RepID=A0A396GB55_MEDTR|nr:chaperone protein DnaJ-like [Medicago truncatula]RHN38906.1 putative DnaJ domain-containing protein [Medicago truncatula]
MIKKQFRKFALQLHPDKKKFAGTEAAFKLIGEAQRLLSDREKRTRYDMKLNVNKTAMPPRSNQPKVPTNFNSAMKNNVRPSFTNSNTQQQQNGVHRTFWTACPFCSVKYEYYREILNKSLRCQQCHGLFVACILDMHGTSPTTNPSQQASKVNVGSQGNSHAEKSNTKPFKKKVPVGVSRKSDVKRKRNQVEEFSQSSDSTSSSDSEDEIVAGKNGFLGVGDHSTEQPRRSVRQKHNVSYSVNMNGTDNDLLQPSKTGQENGSHYGDCQSHGETAKTND